MNPNKSTGPVDLKDRASRAMRAIGVRHPHFLIAWRRVRDLIKIDAGATQTFAVDDRGVIYINPAFAEALTPQHFGGVLVHELMHLALDHAGRARSIGLVTPEGKAADAEGCKIWNIAGDWCINERLRKDGIDLPKGAIYPPRAYPDDRARTTEAFYYWIREQQSQQQPQGGSGGQSGDQGDQDDQKSDPSSSAGGPGDPQVGAGCGPRPTDHQGEPMRGDASAPGLTPSEIRQLAREIRASAHQLGIGTGSSACLEALEPSEARLPWERLLRSGFDSANAKKGLDRPTYAKRSRRSPVGAVLPGWISTDPKIAIMIDVSGSMNRRWVARIVAEVEKLSGLYQAPAYLVTHTSDVCWEGWIGAGKRADVASAVAFSGGTKARPAYEAIERAGKFDVAIHFTDCEIEHEWPECSARRLIVGAFGSGADGTPYSTPPEGAEVIAIMEGGE